MGQGCWQLPWPRTIVGIELQDSQHSSAEHHGPGLQALAQYYIRKELQETPNLRRKDLHISAEHKKTTERVICVKYIETKVNLT